MKDDFPVWFSRMLLLLLLLSYAALLVFLLLQGPSTVWRSVRSEVEIPDLFLLARPQLGLLTGMVYFFMMHCMIPEGRLLIRILTFLFFSLILFWILAKIAFLGFLLVHIFWVIFSFRRKPLVWFFLSFLLALSLISLVFTLQNSGLMEEALSRDGLSFKKYPKALVNSINSRVVLWKASAGLLSENHNFLAGLPSEILEKELQQFTARYNAYLAGRNLNPHNQFLYLMLHYGIAGLLIFLSLWFFLLRQTKNSPALISAVLFFFICGQTEIFIDREFGIQLYLLFFLLILLLPRGPSNLSIRQA
jgi:O-antigen ligase